MTYRITVKRKEYGKNDIVTFAAILVAKSYYEGSIPKNTFGMEKYVATDGENAMFVKSDYQPAPGEVVFYIKRMRSELYCQLYKES